MKRDEDIESGYEGNAKLQRIHTDDVLFIDSFLHFLRLFHVE